MRTRRLGVLLPVSALPSSYGIGTLGLEAVKIEFKNAKKIQKITKNRLTRRY